MAYPAALDSFTTRVDGAGNTILAAHMNAVQTAIVNAQTELGTDPAGSLTDVKTRLAVSLADDGDLRLTGSSTLTIASGVVTATNNYHKIDTEAAAASDTLDTIDGGVDGMVLVICLANSARAVIVGHNTGNIYLMGGRTVTMATANDFILLVYSSALSKWRGIFAPLHKEAVVAKTTTYTALLTDDAIECDASGGAFTVTLPAAATSTGVKYYIKKTDASANAVTIDGNASETIDGATTKALSSQWASYTIICNGSSWSIY
jgi:hypothetical protein